ncbi:predicted protein [Nematostella vectensis]|uniref:Torsin-1A-interacting protein 1/2 AAA+ activator domain-containing protein n=1 Tax=Nematostella vectensis TaxID=45351 RepID=A7RYS6_NEMVE|nr:predicted protein [Nematostella vectensis]|eukprot:XP_001635434.1 predicted protein [Nematostella vectensis]
MRASYIMARETTLKKRRVKVHKSKDTAAEVDVESKDERSCDDEDNSSTEEEECVDDKMKNQSSTQKKTGVTRKNKQIDTENSAQLSKPKVSFKLGTHPVANCLALRLANILDPETEHIENVETVNGKDLQNIDGDIAKKKLDESLHGTFDKGRRAAVVKHLELLPPPSENLFYAYCDNDNARFKHAAILFTVHLQMEPHSSLRPVEAEGMVEKFLSDLVWNKEPYDRDAVAALLSRIADTVALISREDEKVYSHCG